MTLNGDPCTAGIRLQTSGSASIPPSLRVKVKEDPYTARIAKVRK